MVPIPLDKVPTNRELNDDSRLACIIEERLDTFGVQRRENIAGQCTTVENGQQSLVDLTSEG